jgi:hypothetical protein
MIFSAAKTATVVTPQRIRNAVTLTELPRRAFF